MPHAWPRGIRRGRRGCCPGRATPWSRLANGISHPGHPNHRLDVMNPDDVGAAGDAKRDRRGRPLEPLTGGEVERLADERFARGADQDWKSKLPKLGQAPDDLEVLLARFPKTNARVHDNAVVRDSRRPRQLDALAQAV